MPWELVEGEELALRLKRGPVPVDEAIAIAKQIAEALEEAHEHGIVHRDLKPANIKLTPEGRVKVLDFGLAKAYAGEGASGSAADLSQSPTLARTGTQAGMILGTAAYMSPEQARGKPVDKRADIWAFGVVLYEMVTGRRLFTGKTVSDVLAAVLTRELDMTALPAGAPPALPRLLGRCLERDPKRRLRDIGEARLTLDETSAGRHDEPGAPGAAPTKRPSRLTVALASLAAGLALSFVATAAWRRSPLAQDRKLVRFPLSADPAVRVQTAYTTPFAVSPDGRTIVFVAVGENSSPHLWVRKLDDPHPRRLEGTEDGSQPAISPDGEWVAFVARVDQIKKVRLSGGAATHVATLGNASAALGWASSDEIVFELLGTGEGIHRVSANGGTPQLLIPLDTAARETRQRRPFVLRRERMVLYASDTADGRTSLAMFSLADGRRTRLEVDGVQALGTIDGRLVYSRADGSLMAVPFDAQAMRVTGSATQLRDRVASSYMGTAVALSEGGTLAYRPAGSDASRLGLLDAQGRVRPLGGQVGSFLGPRFSPDGRRIAVAIGVGTEGASGGAASDLWMFDRASGEGTRLTRTGRASSPAWAPDGKRLIYISGMPPSRREVWTLAIDGSVQARRLVEIEGDILEAVMAPDGRSLVAVRRGSGAESLELLRVALDGSQSASPPGVAPFANAVRRPVHPRISRDGRWLAFEDAATWEVHVRSLDGAGAIQVTDGGGAAPAWGPDSRRLYYSTGQGWAIAELQTAPTLAVTGRRSLGEFAFLTEDYDLSPDGQTFVVVSPADGGADAMVAVHWADELRRSMPERE